MGPKMAGPNSHKEAMTLSTFITVYKGAYDTFYNFVQKYINKKRFLMNNNFNFPA